MEVDCITEISMDEAGRLLIKPARTAFLHIWREAAEVHWDTAHKALYSPKPREWSYADWYRHILDIAQDQGCKLLLTDATQWINIPPELHAEIRALPF